MTAREVAELFGVTAKTVTKWGDAGLLGRVYRTLGQHRRYARETVFFLYEQQTYEAAE